MTQRRRLDAHLAEQAAERRSRVPRRCARDGAGGGRPGRDGALRWPRGLGSGRDRRRRRQRARRPGRSGSPAGASTASRSKGTSPMFTRARTTAAAPCRPRSRPGRLRVGLPEGRPRQRRRRRLGVARGRGCARTSSVPAPSTGSPPSGSSRFAATGCRCAGPETARAAASAARGRRRRPRRPALGRRDVRGLRQRHGSPPSPCCAGDLDGYEPALERELARTLARFLEGEVRARPFPAPDLRRRPPAARLGLCPGVPARRPHASGRGDRRSSVLRCAWSRHSGASRHSA